MTIQSWATSFRFLNFWSPSTTENGEKGGERLEGLSGLSSQLLVSRFLQTVVTVYVGLLVSPNPPVSHFPARGRQSVCRSPCLSFGFPVSRSLKIGRRVRVIFLLSLCCQCSLAPQKSLFRRASFLLRLLFLLLCRSCNIGRQCTSFTMATRRSTVWNYSGFVDFISEGVNNMNL